MLSPSQFLTPDRGRGVTSLRESLMASGGRVRPYPQGLLKPDLGPELTSTPGPGSMSSMVSPEYTAIQSPGPGSGHLYSSPIQSSYSPDPGPGVHAQYSPALAQQGGVSWAARAEMALSAPTLWQRCEDLKFTLENCPVKVGNQNKAQTESVFEF